MALYAPNFGLGLQRNECSATAHSTRATVIKPG